MADAQRLIDLSASLFSSANAREGIASFLERRPPSWAA
jgi:enoyl-CoA hydratase